MWWENRAKTSRWEDAIGRCRDSGIGRMVKGRGCCHGPSCTHRSEACRRGDNLNGLVERFTICQLDLLRQLLLLRKRDRSRILLALVTIVLSVVFRLAALLWPAAISIAIQARRHLLHRLLPGALGWFRLSTLGGGAFLGLFRFQVGELGLQVGNLILDFLYPRS